MRQRIAARQLRVGMYVCDDERDVEGRVYRLRGFLIRREEEIRVLRRHFDFLYIDPERGTAPAPARVPSREEYDNAERAHRAAHSAVSSLMEDVRLGHALDVGATRGAVEDLTHSILRNPNALLYLTQIAQVDRGLAQRSVQVAVLALAFAKYLSLPRAQLEDIGLGALLADLGMIRVPEAIRRKPGPLTNGEVKRVRAHVDEGRAMVERAPELPPLCLQIVQNHHERFDGKGYPRGLRGRAIDLPSRMVSIVSVYAAMTSVRSYARPLHQRDALSHLYAESDGAFEGRLVQRFIQCVGVYPPGTRVELTDGTQAVVVAVNHEDRLRPLVQPLPGPGGEPQDADVLELTPGSVQIKRVLEPDDHPPAPAAAP